MPTIQTFAPDAPHAVLLEGLMRDGAIIIRDLMSAETADRLAEELMPYLLTTPVGADDFSGEKTTRTGALAGRSATTRELLLHPTIIELCDAVLKPNCKTYSVNTTQAIRIMPGENAQPLHRDRWAWEKAHVLEPELSTIWALTEFTRENGATQIVPGSRDWPDDRKATADEVSYAEMARGSVLVFLGSVFHGGGANETAADRIGVNLTYNLGWLRQEENQYLSCPPELARTLSPQMQALLGYSMSGYALGYYTPPLAPGEGPGIVPPEYAVGGAKSLRKGAQSLASALVTEEEPA
jgi:hypothetical protein